jgi:hypothetical protein
MNLSAKVASALSFAHLSGLGRKSAAKAEDDDEKKDRDHEDGDAKKAKKADSDKPDDEDNDKKDDAKAEDDDADSKAAADDVDEDEDDGDEKKKSKKAKADDDNDEEMRGKSATAQARLREQARCASIFASPAAARNPVLAANLAFKSRMSRGEALAILEATPAAATAGHPTRSAGNPRVGAGADTTTTTKQAQDSRWDKAFASVQPQKRR